MANIRENMTLNTRQKGNIGENVACEYLVNKGFSIILRNYRKYWGEIDIIAKKDNTIHFFEIKSVTVFSFKDKDFHQPEENVHGLKVHHIKKMIQTYFEENENDFDKDFAFHVISVYLNIVDRVAKIKMIENIIL